MRTHSFHRHLRDLLLQTLPRLGPRYRIPLGPDKQHRTLDLDLWFLGQRVHAALRWVDEAGGQLVDVVDLAVAVPVQGAVEAVARVEVGVVI